MPFTEKTWTGSAGLDIGVNIPVSESFSISAETGVRYIANLSGDDSASGGLGLGGSSDSGKRGAVPFTLIGRFDF